MTFSGPIADATQAEKEERERERKAYETALWGRMTQAGRELSGKGQKVEDNYAAAYQRLVQEGLAVQLRGRYR